MSERVMCLI
uniref:BLTX387 n=1 Tax=Nephila pilipes TaxID=299642 RepID=A0A076KTV8_NEPPI|nr:BLTX387 [Nephila pilipes]